MSTITNRPSLFGSEESAYESLKKGILDGRLLPGSRLVIRNLARELGMSPTPIILALRMLERDGLVVNIPETGARVREWSKAEIVDLCLIRMSQEGLACRLCALRASEKDLAAIEEIHRIFVRSAQQSDIDTNLQADIGFHIAIVRGAHCPDLERIVENLAIMQCWMRSHRLSLKVSPIIGPGTQNVHTAILEAIRNRDPAAAEREGQRHVEESLERHLEVLDETEGRGKDFSAQNLLHILPGHERPLGHERPRPHIRAMAEKHLHGFEFSDQLWRQIEPLLPQRKSNRHPLGCHRRRVPDRQVLQGICYVLKTGSHWKALDATGLCSGSTAHLRFQEWRKAGFFLRLSQAVSAGLEGQQNFDWGWLEKALAPRTRKTASPAQEDKTPVSETNRDLATPRIA